MEAEYNTPLDDSNSGASSNVPFNYIPYEVNTKFSESFHPDDRSMMETIMGLVMELVDQGVHNGDVSKAMATARELNMIDSAGRNDALDKVRFQIRHSESHFCYYVKFFLPLGVGVTAEFINLVIATFPTKVLQRETRTDTDLPSGRQVLTLAVLVHAKTMYSEINVMILRGPVTYVDTPTVGPNNEGIGFRRQRDPTATLEVRPLRAASSSNDGRPSATKKRRLDTMLQEGS